jgi:hypothetical protein
MRPETILHSRPDTFSQTVLVATDSSCSSAADHTCFANNGQMAQRVSFAQRDSRSFLGYTLSRILPLVPRICRLLAQAGRKQIHPNGYKFLRSHLNE